MSQTKAKALVIGGGPAGLMAAEMLADAGHSVTVADAKPTVGRKLLMAGKSGLNLTKDEPADPFFAAYGNAANWLEPILQEFHPGDVKNWANALGQDVFTGSSGRVFPKAMKASPLLRAWLERMDGKKIVFHNRWRWVGGTEFDTPEGRQSIDADVTVLALGGASWARLGSDGHWIEHFKPEELAPFQPANMGFVVDWSSYMAPHYGHPVKPVQISIGEYSVRGEFIVSKSGVEGGAIYALSKHLRDAMSSDGVTLMLDLFPDYKIGKLKSKLAAPQGKSSLSNFLRKSVDLKGVKLALFNESKLKSSRQAYELAAKLKALPIELKAPRPIDEAISTAGGVKQAALTDGLMLKSKPGVFCAGEMLDWEAPTGGYLLNACLATGRHAGLAAAKYLG